MHTQTAVIATEAGGVVTEITITALTDEHVVAATALLARLVEATRSIALQDNEPDPIVGLKLGRQVAVSARV